MTSVVSQEESCQDWGLMELGGVFSVEWIHKENIPFQCTQHILNPWNDNKKVQISRDGQVHIQGASQHRSSFTYCYKQLIWLPARMVVAYCSSRECSEQLINKSFANTKLVLQHKLQKVLMLCKMWIKSDLIKPFLYPQKTQKAYRMLKLSKYAL